MSSNPTTGPTQPQILRTYTALHQLHPTWGGRLILSLGLNPAGTALSIAANIAGAVSLAIDNHPAHIRDVVRTGACDFVVTTLDEAIRAMKNEVRKQSPLSIALNADPISTLNEIIERGLLPQLFSTFLTRYDLTAEQSAAITQAARTFQSQGTSLVDFTDSTLLTQLLAEHHWTLQTLLFETPAALRAFDARALTLLTPEDPANALRRRWIEAAPRILQRERLPQRSLWLTEDEHKILSSPITT